jgi:hypothetical protein
VIDRAELEQFRLLSRDSVRSLLHAALINRDADPAQFALWTGVLVSVPPAMYAFRQLLNYSALRFQTAAIIEQAIQVDRMFFLLYGMLVTAMVAAATWEALLPDRGDQEVLGTLPVRPRTAALARLCAGLTVALAASSAVNVPAAVLLAVAAPSHPALGFLPVVFGAHILATIAASLYMFLLMLCVRASFAVVLGAQIAQRFATIVQLLSVAGLAEVFFFIPGVIPLLVARLAAGDATALLLPPMPFVALYAWLVGLRYPLLGTGAALVPIMLAAATVLAVALYVAPARLLARRALESQARPPRGALAVTMRAVIRVLPSSPSIRSITSFTTTTLLRSRPHRLVVTTYAGLALALGTVSIVAGTLRGTLDVSQPQTSLLALPLVAIFFVTLGLRTSFAIPSDIDANWVFRLSRPQATTATHATALALDLLGVSPVVVIAAVAALTLGWRVADVATMALLEVACGAALVEYALQGWRMIPFTCTRAGDVEAVKSHWLGQLLPLVLFAFANAGVQKAVLRSRDGSAWYVAAWVVITVVLRMRRVGWAKRREVQFEAAPGDTMATLSLSDAIG